MKSERISVMLLILVIFFSFCLGQIQAQVITAEIYGTVIDMEEAPLAGTSITLKNLDTGFTRSATADVRGEFSFRSIPTQGTYSITVELSGFKSQVRRGLKLHPNEAYTFRFQLEMSEIAETVVVEAAAPLVNTKSSVIQQVLTEDLVHSVPLIGRNYIELTHMAPGIYGDSYWPASQGQRYGHLMYLVDAASNFSKWRTAARTFYSGYSLETIKEVQILTNQFSVEFGEGMAGINSAITRSGTNDFHGSLYIYERPGAWDEPSFMTGKKAPLDQQQIGFSLAGPIKVDKMHFFVNYEYRRQRGHLSVLAPEYFGVNVPNNQDEHTIFAKVDYQLTDSDYFTARYSNDLFDWYQESDEYDPYRIPGEGRSYVTYVHTFNLSWTKTISERSVNELRTQIASYYDIRKEITNYPDRAGEIRYNWATLGRTTRYGVEGFGCIPELTFEVFDKYTHSVKNHFFKFGGFFKYIPSKQVWDPYPSGVYYFLGSPDKYPEPYYFYQYFSDQDTKYVNSKDIYFGAFIEDEWSVSDKFTLTLGVRYDVEDVINLKGFDAPPDWNNIQPRLGLAYDLFGNGKSVLRGGFGLFTQQFLTYYISKEAFFGADGQINLVLYPGDPNFPTYPQGLAAFPEGSALPPRNINEIDDNLKNSYSMQSTLGFQQEIVPSLTISADAIYFETFDGISMVDRNAPESPTGPRTVAEADATRPITPVANGFRCIYVTGNEAKAWYKAFNLKLERRAADISFLITYTLQKSENMLNHYVPPQDSWNIEDDKGPDVNGDRRHLLNIAFFFRSSDVKNIILKDWQISAIARYQSAPAYTETYGTDLWGTTQRDARPYGRNNLRGEPFYNVDMSLSRIIAIAPVNVELKIDVFNIFNIKNYTAWLGARTAGTNFMQPYSAAPGRRFQLGLHVRF